MMSTYLSHIGSRCPGPREGLIQVDHCTPSWLSWLPSCPFWASRCPSIWRCRWTSAPLSPLKQLGKHIARVLPDRSVPSVLDVTCLYHLARLDNTFHQICIFSLLFSHRTIGTCIDKFAAGRQLYHWKYPTFWQYCRNRCAHLAIHIRSSTKCQHQSSHLCSFSSLPYRNLFWLALSLGDPFVVLDVRHQHARFITWSY